MAELENKIDYCLSETSLAHTYGNMACFVTEFIKSLFQPNYFRTIHVSSTIAYRQLSIYKNKNHKEFLKKSKPMLIIRPRIDMNNRDAFLYGTYLTERMHDNYTRDEWGNLQPFMEDTDNDMYMKFLMNRLTLLFDITIVTETQMEQINLAYYLKNRITPEHPLMLHTTLENYIPREFIDLISKVSEKPVYDSNGSVKDFVDYLNSKSIYPITYKLKDSSGNDEFFRFYPADILTRLSDIDIDDGSKRGVVSDYYTISFSMYTEFTSAGLYYLFTNKIPFVKKFIADINNKGHIIPILTIDFEHDLQIPDGWSLYAAPIYKVEVKGEDDELDISSLFNASITKLFYYHQRHGIPYSTFIHFTVMKDGKQLPNDETGFEVNLDRQVIITHNTNPSSTYRAFIVVNTLYINNLIKDILDLERIDTPKLRENKQNEMKGSH